MAGAQHPRSEVSEAEADAEAVATVAATAAPPRRSFLDCSREGRDIPTWTEAIGETATDADTIAAAAANTPRMHASERQKHEQTIEGSEERGQGGRADGTVSPTADVPPRRYFAPDVYATYPTRVCEYIACLPDSGEGANTPGVATAADSAATAGKSDEQSLGLAKMVARLDGRQQQWGSLGAETKAELGSPGSRLGETSGSEWDGGAEWDSRTGSGLSASETRRTSLGSAPHGEPTPPSKQSRSSGHKASSHRSPSLQSHMGGTHSHQGCECHGEEYTYSDDDYSGEDYTFSDEELPATSIPRGHPVHIVKGMRSQIVRCPGQNGKPCGNAYLDDSLFCRKCGIPRQ
jgi:hypothetical protein